MPMCWPRKERKRKERGKDKENEERGKEKEINDKLVLWRCLIPYLYNNKIISWNIYVVFPTGFAGYKNKLYICIRNKK